MVDIKNITQDKLTLYQWRTLKNYSRQELSEKTGLSYDTIMRYENDINELRSSSYKNLERLANSLGITVDDIFLNANSVNLS